MTDSDRKGANSKKCDWTNLGSDASAPEFPPSTATNTEKADGRKLPPRVRHIRSRRGKRSQRYFGDPLTVELRGAKRVPATVMDKSTSGLSIDVADGSLLHCGQIVGVRERGVRTMAVIRNVVSVVDTCRVGLRLFPA
jgi:hypothetical protein